MVATLFGRAVLNLAGLAVLLPVLALLLDPGAFTGNGALAGAFHRSGFGSTHAFATAVCIAAVLVTLLKGWAVLRLARIERRYLLDLYRMLSRRLYTVYHARGLAFVAANNSSTLVRNVQVVCQAFTSGVLRSVAAIVAEATLLLLLVAVLACQAPQAALLAVGVFLPAGWLYGRMVRRRIDGCGSTENRALREKARIVAETFRGYADIEVNGAFPEMLRAFDRTTDEVIRARSREAAAGQLSQLLPETALTAALALLAAAGFGQKNTPLLFGVFAVAALRLMPSVRALLNGWTALRHNRYTLDILHEALAGNAETADPQEADPDDRLPFDREITLRDLSFRYPGSCREVLRHLNLSIRKGERIGIQGPSGIGKSTLLQLLAGLYEPTSGEILIDGRPLTAATRRRWQNRIGYVPQRPFLRDGTLADNVAPGIPPGEIDRRRVAEALEAAQLGSFVSALPRGIDTPVGECGARLSGGQRQRIAIARALYRRCDLLLFDEATSSLDNRTEEELIRALGALAERNPGMTLLAVAHHERSLGGCQRIFHLGT